MHQIQKWGDTLNIEKYFKDCGLRYVNISKIDIDLLIDFLQNHFPKLKLGKTFRFSPQKGMVCSQIYNKKFLKKEIVVEFKLNGEIVLNDNYSQQELQKQFEVFKKWCDFLNFQIRKGVKNYEKK